MSDSGGRLISSEGEICPGCLSPYTYEIGNFVMKTARIIPGCSHNLCEECIVTDGPNTGQVTCRSPGCSTKVLWTDRRMEDFLPNLFVLGSVAYRLQSLSSVPDDATADIMENPESQDDDNCEMMCGECGDATADCLCQQCNINLCENCFDKIHKLVKSFARHKSLPIATDFIEKKMVRFLKRINCNEHSKMIQYVADDGTEGCDECVIFGKLKGLRVILVKEMEEKARNDLKDKVVEGKDRLDRLKSILSDLESEKAKEMSSSPENLAEKIKTHFSDCHSKLQILEHSLYLKLQKDHIEFNAWQEEIESSVKSTASKIKELSNIIKFSEEALSKDFNPGIYDFSEMVNCFAKLKDDPCEVLKTIKPNSRCLKIEECFMNLLSSHATLSENDKTRIVSGSFRNLHSKPKRVVNDLCGDISETLTVEDVDNTALDQDDCGRAVETTSEHLVCHDIDEVQSNDITSHVRSDGENTVTKKFEPIGKGQRANCYSLPKSTRFSDKSQDGTNNVNLCSDVNAVDAHKTKTLRRKRLSSSLNCEGSGGDDKPPASKKVRNLTPSRSKGSNIVSELSSSIVNRSMIKPRSSKKVRNLMPSRAKDINNVSNQCFQNDNKCTIKLRSSKKVINPKPNENLNKIKPGTQTSQSSLIKQTSEKTYKVSNDLRDCCKTKCKICKEVYSLTSMKTHTRYMHNLKISEYKEIHGPLAIIEVVYHKCQICGKHIFLDCQYLGNHVRNHSMKIRTYVSKYMVRTTKLDHSQNKRRLKQKTDSSCKSKRRVKKSAHKTRIVQPKREETRISSRSSRNISGSSAKKSKFSRKEALLTKTESQPSLGKNPNRVKRRYRPGKAALMETRKFHKTTKIVVPKVPFFKLIDEAAKKAIDVKKRSSLKIEAEAIDYLQEAAAARWDELVVDTLYAIRAKRVARLRKDVILAHKIGGAGDCFG